MAFPPGLTPGVEWAVRGMGLWWGVNPKLEAAPPTGPWVHQVHRKCFTPLSLKPFDFEESRGNEVVVGKRPALPCSFSTAHSSQGVEIAQTSTHEGRGVRTTECHSTAEE